MGQARLSSLLRGHGGVLGLFLLLSWVVAFGTGQGLLTRSFGGDLQSADAPTYLFFFWHLKQAVLGQAELYFTDRLFYPLGLELIRQNWAPVPGLMALPFQALGPLAAYNLQYWPAYTLCGFFTYLLAWRLGRNRAFAILAGIIFAFCEFRTLKVHHFGLPAMAHQEFIPLYLLFTLSFFQGGRWRHALGAGVSFFLATFTSPYQMVFLLLFTVFLMLWQLAAVPLASPARRWTKGLASVAGGWLGFGLLAGGPALLLAVPILANNWAAFVEGAGSLGPVSTLPTDLLTYVTPHIPEAAALLDETKGVYLGWTVLGTVLVAGILVIRQRTGAALWLTAGAIFFLFSLGASLTVGGQKIMDLPFFPLLREIPVIRGARTPARFASVTVLCLALAACLFLAHLERVRLHCRPPWTRWVLRLLIITLVGGELIAVRFRSTWQENGGAFIELPVSRAYDILARQPGDFSVLVTPLVWETATRRIGPHFYPREFFYLQTVHGKKLLSGMGDAVPESNMAYFESLPFVRDLAGIEQGRPLPPPSPPQRAEALNLARFLDIRYVLVHLRHLGGRERKQGVHALLTYLQQALPLEQVFQDRSMALFKIRGVGESSPKAAVRITFSDPASRAHLGVGWTREKRNEEWVAEGELKPPGPGNLLLKLPPRAGSLSLALKLRCPGTPCGQTILLNSHPLKTVEVGTSWQEVRVSLPSHQRRAGINRLRLAITSARKKKTYTVGRTGVRTRELIKVVSSQHWASVGLGEKEVIPTLKLAPGSVPQDHNKGSLVRKKTVPRTVIDGKPGYTVVAFHPQTGKILGADTFDLSSAAAQQEGERMGAILGSIPPGMVVCLTLRSPRPMPLPPQVVQALRGVGADLQPGAAPGPVYALIGAQGAKPGTALEATDPNEAVISLGRSSVRVRSISLR